MGISNDAVARGTGITTNFKDLSAGAVRFVPQRIALIGQGEDGASYSTDKLLIDGGAQQVGSVYGYNSQLYSMARELFPTNGDGVGTAIVEVIALDQPSGGAAATGSIVVSSGTATANGTYVPVVGGVRGLGVGILKGTIDVNRAHSDFTDSINGTLGMPCKAANTYGSPVGTDSANITLTSISVSGAPKGGAYKVVCKVAAAASSTFNLVRPNGQIIATDLAVGAVVEDGLSFTIATTTPVVGEEASILVPVTACDLTQGWKGATGNDDSVSLSIDGPTAASVTITLTAFNGGTGATAVDTALTKIGDVWTTMIVTPESGTTALDAFVTWGEPRWGELVHKPAIAFYGNTAATPGEAGLVTQNRGADRVTCQLTAPGSPNMPWVVAAAQVVRIVNLAQTNPPHDYGSQRVFTITPGADSVQWDYANRDLAIKLGSSTTELKDGVVNISDVVTPWAPEGEDPPAYRYVVDIIKLMQVINTIDAIFSSSEWDGAPLIPDGQPTTNPAAKTPSTAKGAVADAADNLALAAIISDAQTAKKSITANISPTNPKRLDVSVTVQVSGNTNIKDVTVNWGFFFGSPALA